MKYFEVIFNIKCPAELMQDARDLLAAMAGEAGFETFEETPDGLKGYAQQTLFDRTALDGVIADFPFGAGIVDYTVGEAEDRDWNEQWEQQGFEPIVVANGGLVIHDGRHLPDTSQLAGQPSLSVEIDARQAFGTGTHETTRMVCSQLLELVPRALQGAGAPPALLDCGTGTGILSIVALKLGASAALGYDIDEWAVDNARHNAVINHVDERFEVLQGDASVLNAIDRKFQIVVANINRNILLADMPLFREKMAEGATLILSGFYTEDIPLLESRACEMGLRLTGQLADNNWACIRLE